MRILSTSIIILIAGASFSQNFDYLDHNNTNVALPVIGSFFSDVAQGQPGYEVPKGSGNHTMYHARFYFMGLDNNGTLHASLGGSSNGTDVFSGPYSSLDNYDSTYQAYWNGHSSQLCQEEIDNYAIWWEACEGPNQGPQACANAISPSNATLTQIYNWPAHGNASNGEEFYLAPYYDHPESNPGIYDPIDGDYPLIKGCCATYRIDNDAAGTHTFSGADPLGIETHYQTFQYKNFGLLNDVTFVEVTVHNRGTTTYPEFVYGMYADTDLGEPFDDYIGSDSTRSMYYTYNGDNNDANYGIDPPAFGIVGLESPFTSVVQYNGTSSLPEIWNMMNGLSFNGQPILDGQGNTTGFEYGSNPNALGGSSELELQNAAGDRRAMLSTEHGAFAPGDVITQTYALVYVQDGDNLQSVDALYAAADEVHLFYDTLALAQCEGGVLALKEKDTQLEVTMMPNPASDRVEIVADVQGVITAQLVDMSGKQIMSTSGTYSVEFDLSQIQDGAYLVFITSESGRSTKKLLVNH